VSKGYHTDCDDFRRICRFPAPKQNFGGPTFEEDCEVERFTTRWLNYSSWISIGRVYKSSSLSMVINAPVSTVWKIGGIEAELNLNSSC
jgi:hypothetical protein